eukprot:5734998-Pyramimonas_sp.AAC.1
MSASENVGKVCALANVNSDAAGKRVDTSVTGGENVGASSLVLKEDEDLHALSVKELKQRLRESSASEQKINACAEKTDLVELMHQQLCRTNQTCAVCYTDGVEGVKLPCCARES